VNYPSKARGVSNVKRPALFVFAYCGYGKGVVECREDNQWVVGFLVIFNSAQKRQNARISLSKSRID